MNGIAAGASDPVARQIERYREQRVVLLTQHGKEHLIGPILQATLGCRVERIDGYDTDLLGTFTRDIPRDGSQLDAARRKARIGMQLGQSRLGIASEGAFGLDPYAGFFPWNTELVVFIDDDAGIELIGMAQGPARSLHRSVKDWSELETFAHQAGFPEHHLVVRPHDERNAPLHKGLASWDALRSAFAQAADASSSRAVFVENDLRAHCNPTRQTVIREAANNLVARLRSFCPACERPGYWIAEQKAGLPCAECQAPTKEPVSDIWCCSGCGYHEEQRRDTASLANPERCDYCNP